MLNEKETNELSSVCLYIFYEISTIIYSPLWYDSNSNSAFVCCCSFCFCVFSVLLFGFLCFTPFYCNRVLFYLLYWPLPSHSIHKISKLSYILFSSFDLVTKAPLSQLRRWSRYLLAIKVSLRFSSTHKHTQFRYSAIPLFLVSPKTQKMFNSCV